MWRKVATRICAISGQQEQDLIRHHLPIAKSTYVCRKLEKENGGTERKLLKIQSWLLQNDRAVYREGRRTYCTDPWPRPPAGKGSWASRIVISRTPGNIHVRFFSGGNIHHLFHCYYLSDRPHNRVFPPGPRAIGLVCSISFALCPSGARSAIRTVSRIHKARLPTHCFRATHPTLANTKYSVSCESLEKFYGRTKCGTSILLVPFCAAVCCSTLALFYNPTACITPPTTPYCE